MDDGNSCVWKSEFEASLISVIKSASHTAWKKSVLDVIVPNISYIISHNITTMPPISDFAENPTRESFDILHKKLPKNIQKQLSKIQSPKQILCDTDPMDYLPLMTFEK